MPLSKKDLATQLSGLGDNSRVLIRSPRGNDLFEVSKFELENKALVLTAGAETSLNDDGTQQEAGAIKPTKDEILHNTSGTSFAASGSARGINQEGNEVLAGEGENKDQSAFALSNAHKPGATTNAPGPDMHNTVEENLGTEQGSGAISSASGTNTGNAAFGDGTALPKAGQPDAGAKASEVKSGQTTAKVDTSVVPGPKKS